MIRDTHETALLGLRCVESNALTAAEIIDGYHRALHTLRAAPSASRRKVAMQHAESLRKLSASTGRALGEQMSMKPESEEAREVAALFRVQLRQVDRLSEAMRLGLEAVGRLFEARHKVEDIRRRLNADDPPRAGSLNLFDADAALNAVYHPTIEWLEASMKNFSSGPREAVEEIGIDSSAAALAGLVWRAKFDSDVTSGKLVRDWYVARLATAKAGALGPGDLNVFDALVDSIKKPITLANTRAMGLFADNRQQTRAFLGVTMSLLRDFQNVRSELEAKIQPASGALPLSQGTAPSVLTVDTPSADAPSGTHSPGQRAAGSTSRSEGSKKKGNAGRSRRRS
jgi:hypothetical protein